MIVIKKINERGEVARQDSDTAFFLHLMYAGEQLLKLVTSGIISGIEDTKGNNLGGQYNFIFDLVRADSVGAWSRTLDAVLTGPSVHFVSSDFNQFKNELTDKIGNPSWQYGSMFALHECLRLLNPKIEPLPQKTQLRTWFAFFAQLRNDARAHGVISSGQASQICSHLDKSIKLFHENYSLFKCPWIYVKQNLSGSFKFISLTDYSSRFEIQNKIDQERPREGIYLCLSRLYSVKLVKSSIDASDFLFPNGNFTDKTYECISYLTGRKIAEDSSPYLTPATILPKSETEGQNQIDVLKNTFTNLPQLQSIYITRRNLETELEQVLTFPDKYPIVTLSGRGGIGKTSLALQVLHRICESNRFMSIIWLSARDIDLLEEGPKTVKPQILDEIDISREFYKLFSSEQDLGTKERQREFFQNSLKESNATFGPLLLVMDNFETLRNPKQVFNWLDTYVRNPNKVLITSRLRVFKADYPIEVDGMTRDEYDELVEKVAKKLGIQDVITSEFLDDLYNESDGHPYVVKVLLGEVFKQKGIKNVKRIVASKEEILAALFERTYNDLSSASQRIFLTLCSWRNILPEIAIQAILNRPENELIDVDYGIEELHRYSFIELLRTENEDVFISVPLAAFEFGRKKLTVSPLKSKIQLDIQLLNYFGVTNHSEIEKGATPKVEFFLKGITGAIKIGKLDIEKCDPILHFICRRYPKGWLLLYGIYSEFVYQKKVIECLQNFVADSRIKGKEKVEGLELLAKQYSIQNNHTAEAQTLVDICNVDSIDFMDLTNAVRSLMLLFKEKKTKLKKEETAMMLSSVADKMNRRIGKEGRASDFTELAWVYLHLEKRHEAKALVMHALQSDSKNLHALNLARILKVRT
ncbi:MAG: hypothetical protein JNL17_09995 [Cyclobacteriaceae bacterium]|nr:hypothetical protein [Cyclobacteriaceae bacterium]